MAGLDGGRINIGSCSLGAAQASYELAVAYIKERKQFNTPIADYQATQFKIVKMASNINTMRLSLRSAGDGNVHTSVPRGLDISFWFYLIIAAALVDQQHPAAGVHCAMAKRTATDLGKRMRIGVWISFHDVYPLLNCDVCQVLMWSMTRCNYMVAMATWRITMWSDSCVTAAFTKFWKVYYTTYLNCKCSLLTISCIFPQERMRLCATSQERHWLARLFSNCSHTQSIIVGNEGMCVHWALITCRINLTVSIYGVILKM